MHKILITGHTGFVGTALCKEAIKQNFQVLGLSRTGSEFIGIINLPRDLAQVETFDFLNQYKLHSIIHLAANSSVNDCEENVAQCELLNVKASVQLANYAREKGIHFIFASSDQVFDGNKGNYRPEDEANPLNQYGIQKLKAEIKILQAYPKAVICRLPLMIGTNGGYEKAFVENLKAGKEQTLFTDEVRSVAKVKVVASSLLKAMNWEGGIHHLGGPKPMNRYELGKQLAKKHGLDLSLLKPSMQSDVVMKAARPKNVSLINNS